MLFVSHVGTLGGAERTLLDLLQTLDRDRYEARAVLPGPGELWERIAREGVPVDACPGLRRLQRSWHPRPVAKQALALMSGARALHRLAVGYRPHLVHANSTTAALYLSCARLPATCPLIWHQRDLVRAGAIERWIGPRVDRIVAPSAACARGLEGVADPEKIERIPNGIRIGPRLAPDPALRRELGADGPLVVLVGQLVPWKGYEIALEAARIVHTRHPSARFAWIGEDIFSDDPGVARRLEHAVVAHGLRDVFLWLGRRDDVAEIMASAELLVHPAYPEPFGRVVVEAMASELPVVAFAGDHGPSEILDDGVHGVLASTGSAEALAKAICELVGDPERRRRMGSAGRRRALELYDRRGMTRRIEALYEVLATPDREPVLP